VADEMESLLEQIGGEEVIKKTVDLFYPLALKDPRIAHLFPDDIEPVMEKQRRFLIQYFGGAPLYSNLYGHPKMRARHMHMALTQESAEAWLGAMSKALEQTVPDATLREMMLTRLHGTAHFFVNQP
jgi:hemoglobin